MKSNKKIKYSINSSVIIIGAIIAAVLLNSILIAFDDKMSLEIDLTQDEIYKLSDETKELVENIDEEVKIGILYDGRASDETDEHIIRMVSIIEKYIEENENIKYQLIDYYNDPTPLMNDYPVKALEDLTAQIYNKSQEQGVSPSLSHSMIFVSGDRYEVADSMSYYVKSYEKATDSIVYKSAIENVITNKLAALTVGGEKISNILFTQGHGEKIEAKIGDLFAHYGYGSLYIDLVKDEIPKEEKNLIVIDSPLTDFTDGEIQKIDDFLDAGGNLQVYFNPLHSNVELPKLEGYLKEWGIVRNHGVIYDNANIKEGEEEQSNYGYVAYGELTNHEILESIADSKLRVKYGCANPVEIKSDVELSIEVAPVLTTSNDAVLKTVETLKNPVSAGDVKNKYIIALTSKKTQITEDGQEITGKVLVSGSNYAYDTFPLETDCANDALVINSLNWMSGSTATISVEAKDIPQGGLAIENASKWVWFSVLVVVIPVLVLGIGVFVFIKRRYK